MDVHARGADSASGESAEKLLSRLGGAHGGGFRLRRRLLVIVALIVAAALVITAAVVFLLPKLGPTGTSPPQPFVQQWNQTLPSGTDWYLPVMGPTTPLYDYKHGGVWQINSNRRGVIVMDFLQSTAGINASPYQKGGNLRLTLDITKSFGVVPQPGTPLRAVYYIVPGINITAIGSPSTGGPPILNGLLAAFSGRTFLVADPWTNTSVFNYTLPFDPIWTGEDPASSGQMILAPIMRLSNRGIVPIGVGPYRYFFASDGNHTALFEVTYCHEGCEFNGYPLLPLGRLVGYVNASLSAPPFVYYNQEWVATTDNWRSGPGQALLLPLSNATLEVVNVTGPVRAFVPVTLEGQPATVVGSIGFVRATYPLDVFLPVRSAAAFGIGLLNLYGLSWGFGSVLADPSLDPIGAPTNYRGNATYFAFYNGTSDQSHLSGLYLNVTSGALVPIPQFSVTFPGRVRTFFAAPPDALPQVFVQAANGTLLTMSAKLSGTTLVQPKLFPLSLPSSATFVVYAGSFGGTLYGGSLSPWELWGAWTDSVSSMTAAFKLVPSSP